jgi:tetratricopeptide (TPR) repeat protein
MSIFALWCAAPAKAQGPPTPSFLATNYDLSATLDTVRQGIDAVAKIDLKATEVSGTARLELHPNLNVTSVKGPNGKELTFERDRQNSLYLDVTLATPVAAGSGVSITVAYNGLLANAENSPVPGVKAAVIDRDGAYLLLPSRWFPLTDYPSNRYTGTFRLNVPDTFAVAGTGKAAAPVPAAGKTVLEGGRLVYTFVCDRAEPNGTFVAGKLQYSPKQAEGLNVAVYAPPAASANAQDFANAVARSAIVFSDLFGPLPDTNFTVIQIPNGTFREFAAPGVILLSQRAWDPKANDRTIAHLMATQWWGDEVLPVSAADVWVSDGLARYSEALYAEQNAGREAGLKAIDEFAVGALMYEESAPIAQAARLAPYSPEYESVVMNKGAMIFHMVRAQMGDVLFRGLLHDFFAKYQGKSASNADFETMAEDRMQAANKGQQNSYNLRGFFAQWLNSTGVPEFTMEYVVYRTPKGFRIVGKIKQPLDTFHMPVELRIETEGNPETKTVDVTGTESPFTVETFGRPKPGGIRIDPDNLILKSSVGLRARAAIARGEDLAEQGRFYDAVTQYQRALSIQPNRPLANFRMGEAFFYQKNYQAAANAFREALQAVPEPSERWTEVWGHIYLGKIFDLLGQRARAVNEYSKAKQTNDNTSGAQETADQLLKKPYSEGGAVSASSSPAGGHENTRQVAPSTPLPADDKPVLKKRTDP